MRSLFLILAGFCLATPWLLAAESTLTATGQSVAMEKMVSDRPQILTIIKRDDDIWKWLNEHFQNTNDLPVIWDPGVKRLGNSLSGNECNYLGETILYIAKDHSDGRPLTGEEVLTCAIFELFNATHRDEVCNLNELAKRGQITKADYIQTMAHTEYKAIGSLFSFYNDIAVPYATKNGLNWSKNLWGCYDSKKFDEWISMERTLGGGYLDTYNTYYDKMVGSNIPIYTNEFTRSKFSADSLYLYFRGMENDYETQAREMPYAKAGNLQKLVAKMLDCANAFSTLFTKDVRIYSIKLLVYENIEWKGSFKSSEINEQNIHQFCTATEKDETLPVRIRAEAQMALIFQLLYMGLSKSDSTQLEYLDGQLDYYETKYGNVMPQRYPENADQKAFMIKFRETEIGFIKKLGNLSSCRKVLTKLCQSPYPPIASESKKLLESWIEKDAVNGATGAPMLQK